MEDLQSCDPDLSTAIDGALEDGISYHERFSKEYQVDDDGRAYKTYRLKYPKRIKEKMVDKLKVYRLGVGMLRIVQQKKTPEDQEFYMVKSGLRLDDKDVNVIDTYDYAAIAEQVVSYVGEYRNEKYMYEHEEKSNLEVKEDLNDAI